MEHNNIEHCSYNKDFLHFFNTVHTCSCTCKDVKEIYKLIRENFYEIAPMFHVGHIKVSLDVPVSADNPIPIATNATIYSASEGYSNTPSTYTFSTIERGVAMYTVYPSINYTWTDVEKKHIDFLVKQLHLLVAPVRLTTHLYIAKHTDALTGICNHAGMVEKVVNLTASKKLKNFNAAFINIQNFKYINKIFGSEKGNKVLIEYAQKINRFVLEKDNGVFARLGGDNFFAIISKDFTAEFLNFMDSVNVVANFEYSSQTFNIKSHIGLCYLEEHHTISEMMEQTQVALAIARKNPSSKAVWYSLKMSDSFFKIKEVSAVFPQALSNGEFMVYYQPKVDLVSYKIVGAEALVRWDKDGEILYPSSFIPILEEDGCVCELDFYVFDKLCADISRWCSQGLDVPRISSNFSKVNLRNENFASKILGIIRKYNIDPRRVEVEFTETSVYDDYDSLSKFVSIMKDFGITTAIDDFGSSYSSLNVIKDLDPDVIKLDKSFMGKTKSSLENNEKVFKHFIPMANELGIQIFAEGVETEKEAEFLKSEDCRYAQGYLFDKPLPAHEFEKKLINSFKY